MHYNCFSFFFFQAEDGIRDGTVTGVQTCALPILPHRHRRFRRRQHLVPQPAQARRGYRQDRKSVVKGKSVDLGGRRIIKKKKKKKKQTKKKQRESNEEQNTDET